MDFVFWKVVILTRATHHESLDSCCHLPTPATAWSVHDILRPPEARDDCGLNVTLEEVGSMTPGNLASPVPVGGDLFLIDQANGRIYVDLDGNGNDPYLLFDVETDGPANLTFGFEGWNREYIIGVSPGPGVNQLYVAFGSTTLVPNITTFPRSVLVERHSEGLLLGRAPASRPVDLFSLGNLNRLFFFAFYCCLVNPSFPDSPEVYQTVYLFRIERRGLLPSSAPDRLVNPVPLIAFPNQEGPTHKAGAMATAPDGRLLYATGDGLPFGTNGREFAQNDTLHYSKLFAISPDGSYEILAKGLRNPQHMEIVDRTGIFGSVPRKLAIGDPGGITAEEVNVVLLDDTTTIENFGWGIADDGKAREGTFYVGPGVAGIPGTQPPALNVAPVPEPGFIQPHAQYGRPDNRLTTAVVMSGPVTSVDSFDTIKALWSDLGQGFLYATKGDVANINDPDFFQPVEDVCYVGLVDFTFNTTFSTFNDYQAARDGGEPGRVNPRFFRFPDGTAGVLFETTGVYYRITQI